MSGIVEALIIEAHSLPARNKSGTISTLLQRRNHSHSNHYNPITLTITSLYNKDNTTNNTQ
jgi:hypothetical protein